MVLRSLRTPFHNELYDISDMSHPVLLSKELSNGEAIFSSDSQKIYIATGTNGIKIFDISTPINPRMIGSLDTGTNDHISLYNDNKKALISNSYASTIEMINIEDPLNLYKIASDIDILRNVNNIVTLESKNLIFCSMDDKGFSVILKNGSIINIETDGYVKQIKAIDDNGIVKIFIADGEKGLKIYTMDDSDNIQLSSIFQTDEHRVDNITLSHNNKVAFLSGGDGFDVINIEDVTKPVKVAHHNFHTHDTNGLNVIISQDDNIAYFLQNEVTVHIWNISHYTKK